MGRIKEFRVKLARRVVTIYANIVFYRACREADKRREVIHQTYFVINHPTNPKKLIVINRKEFLQWRKKLGITSKEMPISRLTAGCWYMSKNAYGNTELSEKDIETRRLAFMEQRLALAGLN